MHRAAGIIPEVGRDRNQGSAGGIGGRRPGAGVAIFDRDDRGVPGDVRERDPLARVVEPSRVLAGRREPVAILEGARVGRDDQELPGLQGGAGGDGILDALIERDTRQAQGGSASVLELDEFVLVPVHGPLIQRVVVDLREREREQLRSRLRWRAVRGARAGDGATCQEKGDDRRGPKPRVDDAERFGVPPHGSPMIARGPGSRAGGKLAGSPALGLPALGFSERGG